MPATGSVPPGTVATCCAGGGDPPRTRRCTRRGSALVTRASTPTRRLPSTAMPLHGADRRDAPVDGLRHLGGGTARLGRAHRPAAPAVGASACLHRAGGWVRASGAARVQLATAGP